MPKLLKCLLSLVRDFGTVFGINRHQRGTNTRRLGDMIMNIVRGTTKREFYRGASRALTATALTVSALSLSTLGLSGCLEGEPGWRQDYYKTALVYNNPYGPFTPSEGLFSEPLGGFFGGEFAEFRSFTPIATESELVTAIENQTGPLALRIVATVVLTKKLEVKYPLIITTAAPVTPPSNAAVPTPSPTPQPATPSPKPSLLFAKGPGGSSGGALHIKAPGYVNEKVKCDPRVTSYGTESYLALHQVFLKLSGDITDINVVAETPGHIVIVGQASTTRSIQAQAPSIFVFNQLPDSALNGVHGPGLARYVFISMKTKESSMDGPTLALRSHNKNQNLSTNLCMDDHTARGFFQDNPSWGNSLADENLDFCQSGRWNQEIFVREKCDSFTRSSDGGAK